MKKQIIAATAVAGLTLTAFAGTADAKGKPESTGKPAGIACQQAGISALQGLNALPAVAKNGISVGDAVELGVAPRDGLPDGVGLDTVLSFSTVLADHRAGDNSIFVYPWCD